MADDNVIRSSTSVDLSGQKAGMAEAVQIAKNNLGQIQVAYANASTQLRANTQELARVQKAMGDLAALGVKEAAAEIQKWESAVADAAVTRATAYAEMDAAQKALRDSLKQATPAVEEQTHAFEHQVGAVAAASGEIRIFEGALPIRAVEQFTVKTLGLGPIMQAAFPAFGAIAFGEMLLHIIEKVDPLTEAMKKLTEAQAKFNSEASRTAELFKRIDIDEWTRKYGTLAATAHANADGLREHWKAQMDLKAAQDEYNQAAKLANELTVVGAAAGILGKDNIVQTHLQRAARDRLQVATLELNAAEQVLAATDAKTAEGSRKIMTQSLDLSMKQTNQEIENANRLAQDRAKHQAIVTKLDNLIMRSHQELAKQTEESAKKNLEWDAHQLESAIRVSDGIIQAEIKTSKETIKQIEHFEKLFDELEKLSDEELARFQANEAKRSEAMVKGQAETAKAIGEAERAHAQRGGVLSGAGRNDTSLASAQLAATAKAGAGQIAAERQIAEQIRQLHGQASVEYITQMNKIAATEHQVALKTYEDQTKYIQAQIQQYDKFFNIVNQGFEQGWQKTLAGLERTLAQMALKWIEHEAVLLLIHEQKAAKTLAIDKITAIKQTVIDAKSAATGAFQSVVHIPYIGPVLAPIAAATAFAATMALGSFETGTNYVPKTGMYQLHQGEAVVPAAQNPSSAGGNRSFSMRDLNVNVGGGVGPSSGGQIGSDIARQLRRLNLKMA